MARYVFTGGDGATGETGLIVRNGLNANFLELYNSLHARAHSLTSATDHSASAAIDRGKFLKSHPTTGLPVWLPIAIDDLPGTVASASDLTNHIQNEDNPHGTSLYQISEAGAGITFIPINNTVGINVALIEGVGLDFDVESGKFLRVNNTNLLNQGSTPDSDNDVIGITYQTGESSYLLTLGDLKAWLLSGGASMLQTYVVDPTTGKRVEVVATGAGVTCSWSSGNNLSLNIPAGVEVLSLMVSLSGYPNMVLMVNYSSTDRDSGIWYPMMQAWRMDTKNQLVGVTLTGDAITLNKFTIAGLINTTTNNIRITI
jgi:hypothetical protein